MRTDERQEVDPPVDGPPTGVVVAIGLVIVLVGAALVIPFPLAAAGVATWWLGRDLGRPDRAGRAYLDRLGIAALVLLALAGAAVAAIVVGWETHFDCGGTFGGFGESASARVDDDCVDARVWRLPAAAAVIASTTAFAAVVIRRFTGSVRHYVLAVAVVFTLIALWGGGLALFVTA